jgi:hypothetical protein
VPILAARTLPTARSPSQELLGARKKAKSYMRAERAKGKDMDPLTHSLSKAL